MVSFHQISACSGEATPTKHDAASRARSRVYLPCLCECLLRSHPKLVPLKIDSSQSERFVVQPLANEMATVMTSQIYLYLLNYLYQQVGYV